MGEMIRMTMDDGAEIAVYHAPAEGERRGGLVLVQEIFGVTDHIRELCDEYAADGYEVLSPALFDREHPGFESDYSGPQFERAVELARELHPFEQSLNDAQTCIDALKGKGPVFITGYCYGGSVAWRMAQISPDLAAASSYYGSLVPTMFKDEAPGCAAIAHFGLGMRVVAAGRRSQEHLCQPGATVRDRSKARSAITAMATAVIGTTTSTPRGELPVETTTA